MEYTLKSPREKIAAQVIEDSVSPSGKRLTTFLLTFPRIILAEVNTHRVFSRNAASSRAKPVKVVEAELREPYFPIEWGQNKKGMSSSDTILEHDIPFAKSAWEDSYFEAMRTTRHLANIGVHKQWSNRPTEPYLYIQDVVSATTWNGFFIQRLSGSMPEFDLLTRRMLLGLLKSTPKPVDFGEWGHTPFIRDYEREAFSESECKTVSTARCARASYVNFYGKDDINDDQRLVNDMIRDFHPSPFEHVGCPVQSGRTSNFDGWMQFRYEIFGKKEREINSMSLEDIAKIFSVTDADLEF
jgi:hypothetical protein